MTEEEFLKISRSVDWKESLKRWNERSKNVWVTNITGDPINVHAIFASESSSIDYVNENLTKNGSTRIEVFEVKK